MSKGYLIVGAPYHDHMGYYNTGTTFLYKHNPLTDAFTYVKQISPLAQYVSQNFLHFGNSVKIEDTLISIGAHRENGGWDLQYKNDNKAGTNYVYKLNKVEDTISLVLKLTSSELSTAGIFGDKLISMENI